MAIMDFAIATPALLNWISTYFKGIAGPVENMSNLFRADENSIVQYFAVHIVLVVNNIVQHLSAGWLGNNTVDNIGKCGQQNLKQCSFPEQVVRVSLS